MNALFRSHLRTFGGDVAFVQPRAVTVQITEHAGLGHRPPAIHFDPPSTVFLLRTLLGTLRRKAVDLTLSCEPDGRLALRAGAAEAHAPLAYIEGLGTADAILSLAEIALGVGA